MLETTKDAFLGGRVAIAQPKSGHRAGIDAVLLAASVGGLSGAAQSILDVGSGPGTIGLLVAHRLTHANVTCVEIEPQLANMASENSNENGFGARVKIVEANVCRPFAELTALGFVANSFDQVVSNPPFYDEDRCRVSSNDLKRRANSIDPGGLEKWVKFMTTMTRADGLVSLIYPTTRMDELLELMGGRFGGLEIFPIFSRIGEDAKRVIIRGRKGSRAPLKLHRGMVMHGIDGTFRPEAKNILADGSALDFNRV